MGEPLLIWWFASLQVTGYHKDNPMRKIVSEVNKAYISGLIDGDGAIMACIEKHTEKNLVLE